MSHFSLRPIAVALIAALLQGCSGGTVTVPRPYPRATGTGVGTSALPTAKQSGTVALPPGVTVALSSLTVVNSLGSTAVGTNGAFSLTAYSGGAQFTTVTDQKGTIVLAGFLDPQDPTLDVTSTAMVDAIATVSGFSDVVGALGSALAANPDALASSSTATSVTSSVTAFIQQYFSAPSGSSVARAVVPMLKRKRQDVLATPSQFSGITVNPDFPPDGVTFTNTLRRPSEAFFDKVSYVDAGGVTHQNPVTDAIPEMDIPAVIAIPSNVPAAYAKAIASYFTGVVPYGPVTTAEVPTPLNDATDLSTTYRVTVVGVGAIPQNIQLSSEQATASEQQGVKFLLLDMFLPIVLSCITTVGSQQIDDALNFQGAHAAIATLIELVISTAPEVAKQMENGDVTDALTTLEADFANSDVLRAALAQFLVDQITLGTGLDASGQHLQVNLAVEDAEKVLKILNIAGAVLAAADFSAVTHDILTTDSADQFTLTVTQDLVTIVPASATVSNGGTQNFAANVPAQSGSGATLVWTWANTASLGHITDGIAGHLDNFTSSRNTVTYTANQSGSGTDTITVTAFLVQGQNRVQVGLPQTATVTVSGGLVPATYGPISVPISQPPSGIDDGLIGSFLDPPNGPPSTTNPAATFELDLQPHQGITNPTLVSTLFVAGSGGESVTGTALGAVTFQANGSPQLPANTQGNAFLRFFIQQPSQVPANHSFTCSFFQGSTLLGSEHGTFTFEPQIAPNGAELDCTGSFIPPNPSDGTSVDQSVTLNVPYTLVMSQ